MLETTWKLSWNILDGSMGKVKVGEEGASGANFKGSLLEQKSVNKLLYVAVSQIIHVFWDAHLFETI